LIEDTYYMDGRAELIIKAIVVWDMKSQIIDQYYCPMQES